MILKNQYVKLLIARNRVTLEVIIKTLKPKCKDPYQESIKQSKLYQNNWIQTK